MRHSAAIAVAVAVVLCAAGSFRHGLWAPDEPREAEIGREMLLSRWSAVPTLGGEPFLEKPPLFAWTMAASYAVFGVSAAAARVPAVLFSIGSVVVAYLLGRRCGGRLAGVCAAVVLATCEQFGVVSHRAVLDSALTFFVACGHLSILHARDAALAGRPPRGFLSAGLCAGLAFLTKGVVGPVLIVGPPLVAAAVFERSFFRVAAPRLAGWSAAFVALLGAPWVFALQRAAGWDAVHECLVRNTFGRAVGGDAGFQVHDEAPWYYAIALPGVLLPWTLAIPSLVAGPALSPRTRGGRARHLALVALAGAVLLSFAAGKRWLYLAPLVPAAAAAIGVWLSRVGSSRGGRWDRATVVALLASLSVAAALLAYALSGLPIPGAKSNSKIVELLGRQSGVAFATALFCGVAAVVFAWLAVRGARAPAARTARRAAVAVLVASLAWYTISEALLDPDEDVGPGAVKIAALVPEDEPLVALAPDETTVAALTFSTQRKLERVQDAAGARRRLAAGPGRHLIVLESRDRTMSADLRRDLRLVGTVRLSRYRQVMVYAWEGS